MTTHGVVLIAWEHKSIIDLANVILGNDRFSPQKWPDSRFDLVWVLGSCQMIVPSFSDAVDG